MNSILRANWLEEGRAYWFDVRTANVVLKNNRKVSSTTGGRKKGNDFSIDICC
jgi:hypothetical protein